MRGRVKVSLPDVLAQGKAWWLAVSLPGATRSGSALHSGPERGGGEVRGRYVGGRPWAGAAAALGAQS